MKIFVDTSAFLAVLDSDDLNHPRADQIWQNILTQGDILVSTNYVIVETISLIQRRFGLPSVREFHEDVVPLLQLEWIDPAVHLTAVQLVFLVNQRPLNLVDCVSFTMMRRLHISTAFAFDEHFQRQGFTCLR